MLAPTQGSVKQYVYELLLGLWGQSVDTGVRHAIIQGLSELAAYPVELLSDPSIANRCHFPRLPHNDAGRIIDKSDGPMFLYGCIRPGDRSTDVDALTRLSVGRQGRN